MSEEPNTCKGGKMRVGIGYDVHPLVKGRKLIMGGIEISHTHGLVGHSDAAVSYTHLTLPTN